MEGKLKHLEFIQDTINRMAKNSFLLKGWAVTIVGGLLALGFKEMQCANILISFAVLTFFWLLDGYYLHQEKLYIKLYDHVRMLPEEKVDFSMNTKIYKKEITWAECSCSRTMRLFYGGLLVVQVVIFLII